MKIAAAKTDATSRCPQEYWRMIRLCLGAAYLVALGLGHIHLRMTARDLDMQACRYQAEATELLSREGVLRSEISRLQGGDRILDYATAKLGLVPPSADEIVIWKVPNRISGRYQSVCSEIALARSGGRGGADSESLVGRLLVAFLTPARPVQAQPAGQAN